MKIMICRSWLSILICSMVSVLNAQTVNTINIESDTGSNLFELQELQSEVVDFAPSLLNDWRDIYGDVARFGLGGEAWFRRRGLDMAYTQNMLMGVPMNDLVTGRAQWWVWGGLNSVFNGRSYGTQGLAPATFAFSATAGNTYFDVRAGNQRTGIQASYMNSNRSYDHRLMAAWSSGFDKKGWAASFCLSTRLGNEGYVAGTFYEGYAAFVGVEKKFNLRHRLAMTAFASPTRRGKMMPATQEAYDLAGSNFYNPNWGWQNGEKRNSRVNTRIQPVVALTHELKFSPQSSLITTAMYQGGKESNTRMDWYNASDPRPDYYRYLPTYYYNDPYQFDRLQTFFQNNPDELQLDWDKFYQVNTDPANAQTYTLPDGSTTTGIASRYVIEEQVMDVQRANIATRYYTSIGDHTLFQGGLILQYQDTRNYKVLDDLLGGDFYVDLNEFAERDFPTNPLAGLNNVDDPNYLVSEGEEFGYNYNARVYRNEAWAQAQYSYSKIDFHWGGRFTHQMMQRIGNYRVGLFPENSFGKSDNINFYTYGVKGGVTWKINGRNYLFVNVQQETRAPLFQNVFLGPRTRNQTVNSEDLVPEKILSLEGGYIYRSQPFKIQVTGYLVDFKDQIETIGFYHDEEQTFVNYTQTGIDKRHYGLEFATLWQINSELSVNTALSLGENIYTSRPNATITQDNIDTIVDVQTVYARNFHVSGTPEIASTTSLNYRSRYGFFVNLSFNWTDRIWMQFNPVRRTFDATQDVFDETTYNEIIAQEKAPAQFTMDLFGGYSYSLGYGKSIRFLLGVNNLTNNQNFITNGFEQRRFDFDERRIDKFQNKYFYGLGTNYFAMISFIFG
ncbi:MAG TPA: hypothetical protein DCF84_08750 [Bacteroidetes bacterium]|nr:hypothetical protein [Bacteroidota bacterium]